MVHPALTRFLGIAFGVCLLTAPCRGAEFAIVTNTQPETVPLSAPAALPAQIRLPTGFHVTVAAAEPEVRNPIAMTFDSRGRLWIAENYTYAEASVGFDLKLHDRVLIFEDTDGDGVFDVRKVFWEGAQKLTSVSVGFGGVWLLCPPHLLFLPDRNEDDVPDGPPEVMLDGFDSDRIRHNFANGLKWGPDGWLYGRHGITTSSFLGKPGTPPSERVEINTCIWRFHPVRRVFDVVTRGGTNPWGHDWDAFGELFYINTVIGHLWHAVPGLYTQRMFGEHGDPHLFGVVGQIADHYHWDTHDAWHSTAAKGVSATTDAAGGGHAHSGMMIYQGDNWPRAYRDALFTVNLHGHRLNVDRLERSGAGYVGRHAPDFAFFPDPWFRAVDLGAGPDGGVFVIDWSDIGECHENDGVHRTSGRIYKVTYGKPAGTPRLNLSRADSATLIAAQQQPNEWLVRQARLVLQERATRGEDMKSIHRELLQRFQREQDPTRRLRLLWCLHVTVGAAQPWLLDVARHDADEHLRAWAWRLLLDAVPGDITRHFVGGTPSSRSDNSTSRPEPEALAPEILAAYQKAAAREQAPLVKLYLASLLQKFPLTERLPAAAALAADDALASDPIFGHLLWYGAMPAVPVHPQMALRTLAKARLPFYRQSIARRLAMDMSRSPAVMNELIQLVGAHLQDDLPEQVLAGAAEAVRGWRHADPPPAWAKVGPRLTSSRQVRVAQLARELAVVFGDGRAAEDLKKTASDRAGDLETRKRAVEALVQTRTPELTPFLLTLLDDHNLAPAAVRGIAASSTTNAAEILLREYPRLYPPGKVETLSILSSRPAYALALLQAIRDGRVQRQDIPAFNVRQMRSLEHPVLNQELDRYWNPPIQLTADKQKRLAALKALLTPARVASGNLKSGRATFQQTCATCHKLYGEGTSIGPDLTGSDRRNLDYLLENILDPSALVAADYRVSIVNMKDGQTWNGIPGVKTDRTLELQTPSQKLTLERAEIDSVENSALSLMPEGLLEPLPETTVIDLFAYLMSVAPPL